MNTLKMQLKAFEVYDVIGNALCLALFMGLKPSYIDIHDWYKYSFGVVSVMKLQTTIYIYTLSLLTRIMSSYS